MTSRWKRLLAVLFCFALIAAACGDDDDSGTTATPAADDGGEATPAADDGGEATPAADDGGEATPADDGSADDGAMVDMGGDCDETIAGSQLDYGIFAPNSAFDPTGTSGALVGGTENAAVFDVLFIFDPVSGETKPHLAESMTPNDDLTVWTLKLREGIAYSDGTPLTAQLVSDNIDRYFEEGVRNTSGGFLQFVTGKSVVDDVTLEMTVSTPIADLAIFFADEPGMIVNIGAIGADLDAFRVQPPDAAGLGPYVVERNVPGEETVLKARSDYWGGTVCIETIRMTWVPGSGPNYEAFKNGDLNAAFLRDPIVNAEAIADGVNNFFFNQDGGAGINFNHREGFPTADPRVREAIMLAIDETVINDRAYQGQLEATKAYFGPNSRFFSDAIEPFPTDPERAAALVAEVIAEGEWDGSIHFVGGNTPPAPDTMLAIQGMLEAVGMTVELDMLDTVGSITKLGQGDFDMITNGWNSGPGTGVLSLVRNASSTSPTNRQGYMSPVMDGLLNDALAASNEELPAAMAAINALLNSDFVALTYGVTSEGLVWADDVSGITPTMSTIFLFHAAKIG